MPKKILMTLVLLAIPVFALAQAVSTPVDNSTIGLLSTSLSTALDATFNKLTTVCVTWLGGFILLQMIFTQISNLLNDGDLARAGAKFAGGFFWAMMCYYLFFHAPDFIKSMSNYLMGLASGLSGNPFNPSYPIDVGINSAGNLLNSINGRGIFANLNPFPAIMMGLVSLIILASCAVIAFRIFMILVETKIVIALSPISFSLMGMNALRDQGFVPLKYLIAMAYRVLVLGAVLAAMAAFSAALVSVIANLPPLSSSSVWPPVWVAAIGYSLIGALAWNSNAIASSLASGSSSMTTSDMGGPSAMAGAVGAAVGASLGPLIGKGLGAASDGAKGIRQLMAEGRANNIGVRNGGDTGGGGGDLGMDLQKPDSVSRSLGDDKGIDSSGANGSDSTDKGIDSGGANGSGSTNKGIDSGGANDGTPAPAPGVGEFVDGQYGGTPNTVPGSEITRDPARDAARAARRAAKQSGTGQDAGIGGSSPDSPTNTDKNSTTGSKKGVLDHLGDIHEQASSGQTHAVHVSINTHHDL